MNATLRSDLKTVRSSAPPRASCDVALTDAQRRLVEQHIECVRITCAWWAKQTHRPADEYWARAYRAMHLAAQTWTPEGGSSFRNYAIRGIRAHLCAERSQARMTRRAEGDRRTLRINSLDFVVAPAPTEQEIDPGLLRILNQLDDTDKLIIRMRADGATLRQIGTVFGCSHQNVHHKIARIQSRCRRLAS